MRRPSLFFPSELRAGIAAGSVGRLAGRVLRFEEDSLEIADAMGTITLAHSLPSGLAPSSFVELQFRGTSSGLEVTALIASHPPASPSASEEFLRLHGKRAQTLEARARALRVVRAYFESESFLEVDTPTFVPCPGLDPYVHSLAEVRRGPRVDYLITSPELHMKRLLAGGLPRIYQFARCFRAEELGSHHEPEFTLLEWYRAFCDYDVLLNDTEEIVTRVFNEVSGTKPTWSRPFSRLTVREAFAQFAPGFDPVRLAEDDPGTYFQIMVDLVDPGLAQLPEPTFLTEFPRPFAALARACPHDPAVAERFELYVRGVELCNGYGELTDAQEQRARFEAEQNRRRQAGEPVYPLDEKFLRALAEGFPPSSGNALGFDRLVALACGHAEIAHTFAFTDSER